MHILLAIDSSDECRKAARFVAETVGSRTENVKITVFHVVESLPDFILTRRTEGGPYEQIADEWAETRRAAGETLLAETREALISGGVSESVIETKLAVREALPEAKKVVAALAVIEEMKDGPYSVVCLGRRGDSPGFSPFPGSVAEKVLREAHGKTVWVVD